MKWKAEEIDILKEYYPKYGAKYLAEKLLDRKETAILEKARKLKIKYEKIKEIYFEENLRPIVTNSKSLTECLEKMKLRTAGGNYKVLNKYIKLYNIATKHFTKHSDRTKNAICKNKKKLSEILIENSTYCRTSLKKRIVDENILEYRCEKCKNKGEWNGEKLTLQLDHKNGIHNDNRLENLRFLCPNCHSQTKTYAGKNTKDIIITNIKTKTHKKEIEKYYCSCGNEKNKQSKNCSKCSSENRRKIERPTYEELLKEIKNTNYSAVGRKYGVSDNAIRKWMKYYEESTKL